MVLVNGIVSAAAAAAAATATTTSSSSSMVMTCPDPNAVQIGWQYHQDTVCDRAAQNAYKGQLGRHLKYKSYKEDGHGVAHIPNQRTTLCPWEGAGGGDDSYTVAAGTSAGGLSPFDDLPMTTGFDTVWIVENTASVPVVVAHINSEGMEVSAKNPKIRPPQADPAAILQPNEWLAVNTFEGHKFKVREILEDGNVGDVMLQHTVGLIPIGEKAAEAITDCPMDDIEPIKDNVRDPAYARTPPAMMRPCNTMDIGFRNMAGCPLHAYYVQAGGPSSSSSGENTSSSVSSSDTPAASCTELFKFHLGVNPRPTDFMWDWQSPTKYEGTFTGHSFVFRFAHDPNVVIDQYTLQPTRVIDCPRRKVKESVPSMQMDIKADISSALLMHVGGGSLSSQPALLMGAAAMNNNNNNNNTTRTDTVSVSHNGTLIMGGRTTTTNNHNNQSNNTTTTTTTSGSWVATAFGAAAGGRSM